MDSPAAPAPAADAGTSASTPSPGPLAPELIPATPAPLAALLSHGPRSARRSLLVLYAAGLLCAGWVLWPFRGPLFLAGVLAGALLPAFDALTKRLGGRRHAAAGILVFGLFALLVAPIASVAAFAIRELAAGLAWLRDAMGVHTVGDLSWDRIPEGPRAALEKGLDTFHISREQLAQLPDEGLHWLQTSTAPLLGASVQMLAGAILMLAAFYVLLLDGRGVVQFLGAMSPLSPAQTKELVREFRVVSTAALAGTAATALVQGGLATMGYLAAGVPQALFLGITTLLSSFIPVIGTGLVWVPTVAVLAIQGKVGAAIGVAVWCGVVVTLADNVVKPLVMKNSVAMHTGLLFLALLGGLAAFGLLGIILGPLVVSFVLAVQRIYLRDYLPPGAE
jgi:predicted PurR-regulated permease PerM